MEAIPMCLGTIKVG